MLTALTPLDLIDSLAAVQPMTLQGLELWHKHRPDLYAVAPGSMSPEELRAAQHEMINYSHDCEDVIRKLHVIEPVPLLSQRIPEFGL